VKNNARFVSEFGNGYIEFVKKFKKSRIKNFKKINCVLVNLEDS
jgi:hypothetical protein